MAVRFVNGAAGPVASDRLGVTLPHEHVVSANWNMRMCFSEWFDRESFINWACEDVRRTKELGVTTLVDCTPVCLGRDTGIVREVALRTGMQIICSAGFFHTEDQWMANRPAESFLHYLMHDIEHGLDGTDVLPGQIKLCTDAAGMTPVNERVVTASAVAARESGLPVSTHMSYRNRSAFDQLRVLEKERVPMNRVLIGHAGDTNDIAYLEEILRHGCYIGLDRFGDEAKNSLENRVNTLMELCSRGWIGQLMISHDYVSFVDIGPWEWRFKRETDPDDETYNSRFIHRHALPLLREKGFAEADIERIMVKNPRAYFEA